MAETQPTHAHHAYILTGSEDDVRATLPNIIKDQSGITLVGNPDVWEMAYDTCGVEDVHTLRRHAQQRAVGDHGRAFICYIRAITGEAQNALLKTIEEPAENTTFFFVVPYLEMLLPTVRSRMMHLDHTHTFSDTETNKLAQEFLIAEPHKRLELVQGFITEKSRSRALAFLDYLEYATSETKKRDQKFSQFLFAVYQSKRQCQMRGGSLKLSLEHLAVTAPRISN